MQRSVTAIVMLILLIISVANVLPNVDNNPNISIEIQNVKVCLYNGSTRWQESNNPEITRNVLPPGVVGNKYSTELEATKGSRSYNWKKVGGDLPPGLYLSEDGSVSGEPEWHGTYVFWVRVTDYDGNVDTEKISIEIKEKPTSCFAAIATTAIMLILIGLIVVAVVSMMRMKFNQFNEEQRTFVARVEKFGDSAHVRMKKDQIGSRVKVLIPMDDPDKKSDLILTTPLFMRRRIP